MSSRAGGGSRASDEDGKTSVKVGKTSPDPFAQKGGMLISSSSCPCAASSQAHGSRIRADPATIPTVDGPSHIADELSHRVSTRT